MTKTSQRKELLVERLLHGSDPGRPAKDFCIQASLEKLPEFINAKKILLYSPINGEVDTLKVLKTWIAKKELYLPRVDKERAIFHVKRLESLEDLVMGKFNIPEPKKEAPEIDPKGLDLVIVPGVGFDSNGNRIGFGLGYYDRTLKKTSCPKIGLAYEFQIVDNVPGQSHDVPADIILTEKRIINTM